MENILTVSRLNGYIKGIFESEELLQSILVLGEVSNFTISSNNAYFNIKDDEASLPCVCFGITHPARGYIPKNGESVIVRGSPNFYAKGGKLSFNVSRFTKYGAGLLFNKYNELKAKLEKAGVFDVSIKKRLPAYPQKIGVITSETGAVIQDIINITRRRNKNVNLILYPVKVQGSSAACEIVSALKFFDDYNLDIIILARGGGSFEDFEPFNSEEVVMAIYNCITPVISAVGHETDVSLSDFAADLRAPTPSAAAEIAVPDVREIKQNILSYKKLMHKQFLELYNKKLSSFKNNVEKLYLLNKTNFNYQFSNIINIKDRLDYLIERAFLNNVNTINNIADKLSSLNPTRLLKQGYLKAYKGEAEVVSTKQLSVNDNFTLQLSDGKIEATVTKINFRS